MKSIVSVISGMTPSTPAGQRVRGVSARAAATQCGAARGAFSGAGSVRAVGADCPMTPVAALSGLPAHDGHRAVGRHPRSCSSPPVSADAGGCYRAGDVGEGWRRSSISVECCGSCRCRSHLPVGARAMSSARARRVAVIVIAAAMSDARAPRRQPLSVGAADWVAILFASAGDDESAPRRALRWNEVTSGAVDDERYHGDSEAMRHDVSK